MSSFLVTILAAYIIAGSMYKIHEIIVTIEPVPPGFGPIRGNDSSLLDFLPTTESDIDGSTESFGASSTKKPKPELPPEDPDPEDPDPPPGPEPEDPDPPTDEDPNEVDPSYYDYSVAHLSPEDYPPPDLPPDYVYHPPKWPVKPDGPRGDDYEYEPIDEPPPRPVKTKPPVPLSTPVPRWKHTLSMPARPYEWDQWDREQREKLPKRKGPRPFKEGQVRVKVTKGDSLIAARGSKAVKHVTKPIGVVGENQRRASSKPGHSPIRVTKKRPPASIVRGNREDAPINGGEDFIQTEIEL